MMSHRIPVVAGAVVVVMAVGWLSSPRAQFHRAEAQGLPFKTSWGDPDLQGIWAGETLTPLQRPARFADKPVLSPEEAKKVVDDILSRPGREDRTLRGTEKDVAGAYNQIFVQRGTQLSDRRTSLVIDPPDGRIPSYTPEAQKRVSEYREYQQALLQGTSGGRKGPLSPRHGEPSPIYNADRLNRADGPEDRSLLERCLAGNLPNLDGNYRIVQTKGQVGISIDWGQGWGFVRVIPVDGSQHLPSHMRMWNGDARGRWEGDTLVVDIANFSPKTDFHGSRENLHVVERFKRAGPDRLEYTVTVEDPAVWTRPWTFMVPWFKQSDKANQFYESACHEGNYGMVGMLSNARAAEKLFKAGKGPDPRSLDIATGGDTGGGLEREP